MHKNFFENLSKKVLTYLRKYAIIHNVPRRYGKEARPMGDKKKRRQLREQQAARKARMIEIAIDILTAILSGLVTAVLTKLLKL